MTWSFVKKLLTRLRVTDIPSSKKFGNAAIPPLVSGSDPKCLARVTGVAKKQTLKAWLLPRVVLTRGYS